MRVGVVTIVHHPEDARILYREIGALLDSGHLVTYVAPWSATGTAPPADVEAVDVPRASGRRRLRALLAARRAVRQLRDRVDLLLLHDPDLLVAVAGLRRPPTVWDVHEDTAAALADRTWVLASARPVLRRLVRAAERLAERRMHLLLAESGYRVRFRGLHPVVPNEPVVPAAVPPPGEDRVVYVGRISEGRGADTLLALPLLLPDGVRLELLGEPAVPELGERLAEADRSGRLRWRGFVPYDEALQRVEGALCGLSLLRDLPNYRHSRPTKIVDYMSRGVPVVTTPNLVAEAIVAGHGCGVIVPFDEPDAVADAVRRLRDDAEQRRGMGERGHRTARERYNWADSGPVFVNLLERWSAADSPTCIRRARGIRRRARRSVRP